MDVVKSLRAKVEIAKKLLKASICLYTELRKINVEEASTSDNEKQIRELFINELSLENYLEAEKSESGISLDELVGKHGY
ncbi:hypothetical protein Glove_85g15 [Diversispora epigaea]|uniref:Uncharacterized protein n=1 Tax=Diversispora epigaea TaxID=1348612 RepID=A0A397JDY5_9GLOM|nr:hypothetical protein Glove_85g15 [Diversispora epigaea]